MKAPSLRQIQQLFPLGNIEFDDKAIKELNTVVGFRNLLVSYISAFQEQASTDTLNEMIEEDNEGREQDADGRIAMTQDEHNKRVFRMVCKVMADIDDIQPGIDVMIADNNFKAQSQASETIQERMGGLAAIGMIVGGGPPQVPFSQLQCAVHAIVHWLFSNIVGSYLYRMHPELRFPVHRVIEFNVDVPDGSPRVQAIITGYNTKLLLALASDEETIIPDTPEGLFDE